MDLVLDTRSLDVGDAVEPRAEVGPCTGEKSAIQAAFLEALDAIDPRISKPGKDDQSVSRGLDQCGSIKTTKDRAKLIELTLDRFTIATRLPDINNTDTGGRILDAVHKNLCPDF